MVAMGAPEEVIEAARNTEDQEEICWVWGENWSSVLFFFACSTQWIVGMAGRTGLNYPGVESVMRINGIKQKDRKALFADLQVMEFAALEVLNKKEAE